MKDGDRTLDIALLQINGARDPAANIETLLPMIAEAAAGGAQLVCTPEVSDMVEPKGDLNVQKAQTEADHGVLAALRAAARDARVWLAIGSVLVRHEEGGEAPLANRSFLVDDQGEIRARYDKIHMFDVEVGDGQTYRESARIRPGGRAVVADTPWARLGLTVCYDVRFPYLYRALAKAGAEVLLVPAAFTAKTGSAHWHTLLRARAIETGCFVVAAAQTGTHAEGRQTYGHALVIDPWGEVLSDAGTDPGITRVRLPLDRVREIRQAVPSLGNDRPFAPPGRLTPEAGGCIRSLHSSAG